MKQKSVGSEVEAKASKRRRDRAPDDVTMSVRLPKVAHDELRKLAFEERVPLHTLILDGVGMYLRSRGVKGKALEALL